MSRFTVIRTAAAILVVTVALVFSGCMVPGGGDPLVWLEFPLKLEGTLFLDGSMHGVTLECDTPSHGIITVSGIEYYLDGESESGSKVILGALGTMLPIAVMPPFAEFFTGLLTLDENSLASTESDGECVTAVFEGPDGEYTIVTDSGGELLSAEHGGIRLTVGEMPK